MSKRSSLQSGGLEASMWADGHQGRNRHPSEHSSVVGIPRYNYTNSHAPQSFAAGQVASLDQTSALAAQRALANEQQGTLSNYAQLLKGTAQPQTNDTRGMGYEQTLVPTGEPSQPYNTSKTLKQSTNFELLSSLSEAMDTSEYEGMQPTQNIHTPKRYEQQRPATALKATQNFPHSAGYEQQLPHSVDPATEMPARKAPKYEQSRKVEIPPHLQPKGGTGGPQVDRQYAKLRHLFDERSNAEDTDEGSEFDLAGRQKAEQDQLNSEWYAPTPRTQIRPPSPEFKVEEPAMGYTPGSKPVIMSANTRIEMPIPSRKHQEAKLPFHIQKQVSPSKAPMNRRDVETTKLTPVKKPTPRYEQEGSLPPHLRRGLATGNSSGPTSPDGPSERFLPPHQQAKENLLSPHGQVKPSAELPHTYRNHVGTQPKERAEQSISGGRSDPNKALPPHLRSTSTPGLMQTIKSTADADKTGAVGGPSTSNRLQQKENLPPHLLGRQPQSPTVQKTSESEAEMKQPQAQQPMLPKHVHTKETAAPPPVSKPTLGFTMTNVTTIYGDESPKKPVLTIAPIITLHEIVNLSEADWLAKINADQQKAKAKLNGETQAAVSHRGQPSQRVPFRTSGQLNEETPLQTSTQPSQDLVPHTSGQPSQDLPLRNSDAVRPQQATSVGTSEQERPYKNWLAKGTIEQQMLQQNHPRAKTRTAAEAWGRGLVGETRTADSTASPSTIYFDEQEYKELEQKGLTKNKYAVQNTRAYNVNVDAEIAAAAGVDDRDLPGLVDEHVARSIQEIQEPKIKPRYEPPPEDKAFWTNEPGVQLPVEPQQVRCNVCISNSKNYKTFERLQEHKLHRHNYCIICDIDFQDIDTLNEHRMESADHHYCIPCSLDFVNVEALKEHIKQLHPNADAKIPCTRCGRKFVSGSALLHHFEKGHCTEFSADEYTRSRYLMSHYQRMGLEIEGDSRDIRERRHHLESFATYFLGEDNLKEEFKRRYAPSQNPFDRAFDPTPLLGNYGKYICPYAACTYSSDRKSGITFHLQNGHFRQLTCPSCHEKFATPSGITAHMEKENRRCRFTHNALYEDAIRAISGGFLRAQGMNPDGTHHIIGAQPPDEEEMRRKIQALGRRG